MPLDEQDILSHNYDISKLIDRQKIYAPEAIDMLERVPSKLIRWGTISIILIIGILLTVALFVHYPDMLEGTANITTDPLPIQLKAQSNGRIVQLFVHENELVAKDEVIAEIENNTGLQNIRVLQRRTDSLMTALRQNDLDGLKRFYIDNLQSLGEGQTAYNQLLQNISAYVLIKRQHIFNKRVDNIQIQNKEYQKITNISNNEAELISEELIQADERFKANEKLYIEKVISRQEYYDEAARLRQKKLSLEQQKRSEVQNSVHISDNSKQLFEMTYDKEEKENTLILAIEEQVRNLQNFIASWRRQYLITAPYSGHVYGLRPLQANDLVNSGEALFSIVPDKFHYIAYAQLPAIGLGKIRKGQSAHLLLDHFPYNEYGYLEGKVNSVSAIPQNKGNGQEKNITTYRVYLQLPDSLITSYHNKIRFLPEMSATARVITEDKNLLQRMFAFIAKADK